MRDLTLAISSASKRKTKSSVSPKILNLSLLTAIVFFGLLYFFQMNFLSTSGYQIRRLGNELSVLEDQQTTLQLQASEYQSIIRVQAQSQKLNFVPVTNVTYLKDSDFALK